MRTKTDKVRYVLTNYPETRDDDRKLILYYYWNFYREGFREIDGSYYIDTDTLLIADSPETIRRTRQKFQENGEFPSSEQIAKMRAEREGEFRSTMPNAGWENTINT